MLRPRLILVANIIALVVNIAAVVAESGQWSKLNNICATVDKPTTFQAISVSTSMIAFAVVVFLIAGLCLAMTIAWYLRKRSRGVRMGPVIRTALFLAGFALVNILLAYFFNLSLVGGTVTCSGGV